MFKINNIKSSHIDILEYCTLAFLNSNDIYYAVRKAAENLTSEDIFVNKPIKTFEDSANKYVQYPKLLNTTTPDHIAISFIANISAPNTLDIDIIRINDISKIYYYRIKFRKQLRKQARKMRPFKNIIANIKDIVAYEIQKARDCHNIFDQKVFEIGLYYFNLRVSVEYNDDSIEIVKIEELTED